MKKTLAIIISLLLIPAAFTMSAAAEDSQETRVEVYVITDQNLTAIFNGTATNGSVSYFIDGIEVKGEFMSIWDVLGNLRNDITYTCNLANTACSLATDAQDHADENEEEINGTKQVLGEHAYTLAYHYDAINDTYNKLYVLRDEVVAFEDHFLVFENNTNATLNNQGDKISTLRAKVDNLNGFVGLLKNAFIVLVIAAVGIYLVNKRYPFGELVKNKRIRIARRGKQYKISAYMERPKRTVMYILTHIRRNKDRSPLKFLFSFLQVNR